MKKFILKLVLFLFPILIISIIWELLLRNIPNDYKLKEEFLDNNSKNIEVLILGSSHALYGLDPEFFSEYAFNASYVSQYLDIDFDIFSKYSDRFEKLKAIVVPVSYFSLYGNLENSSEFWRMKNYVIYCGIGNVNDIKDHSELLSGKLSYNYRRTYSFYVKGLSDVSCSALGWGYSFKSTNSCDLKTTGIASAKRHTYDIFSEERQKIYKKNIFESLWN